MEKKELLGVRNRLLPGKRRRKVAAAVAGGGGGGLAKAITAYLASDTYMYVPLVSDPQTPTPTPPAAAPSAVPATGSPEKEVTLVQKYRGSWRGLPARSIRGHVVGIVDGVVAHEL